MRRREDEEILVSQYSMSSRQPVSAKLAVIIPVLSSRKEGHFLFWGTISRDI